MATWAETIGLPLTDEDPLEKLDDALGEAEMKITEQVLRTAAMQARGVDTKVAVQTLVPFEDDLIEHRQARDLLIETMRLSEGGQNGRFRVRPGPTTSGDQMAQNPIEPPPTFLPASLAASDVGTWDYDAVNDRLRYCAKFAALYGLPAEQGGEGVPIENMAVKIHPDDRARGRAKRMQMLRHGGTFVFEYRVLPSPQVMRWLLLRGSYQPDSDGQIRQGRGIAVDVTESKQEGYADGDVFFVTEADDRTVSALDRAARYVLAARRALDELGPDGVSRLRPAADMLLLEIAQHIASTMIPVTPNRTEH